MSVKLEDVMRGTYTPIDLVATLGLYFSHTGLLAPADIEHIRRLVFWEFRTPDKVLLIRLTHADLEDRDTVLGTALLGKIMEGTGWIVAVPDFEGGDSDNPIPANHRIYSRFYRLPSGGYITSNMAELNFDFTTSSVTVKPIFGFANPYQITSPAMVEERERYRNDSPVELTDEDVAFLISKQTDVPSENALKTQLQVGTLYIAKTILSTGGICGIKEESEYGLSVYYEFGGVIPLSFNDGLSQHHAKDILILMARNHSVSRMLERETFEVNLSGRDPATVRPFDIPE